jgi:hypothetical protein
LNQKANRTWIFTPSSSDAGIVSLRLRSSDFIASESMPLSLRLEEITRNVYGGISAQMRDKLRKKERLKT